MKLYELLFEKTDPPSSEKVRSEIKKNSKDWQKVGSGASASVWVNKQDPDVAFKVIGGGDYDLDELNKSEKFCAFAFVDFCVHEGTSAHPSDEWRNHYPNIFGINTDDEHVIQIKMQTLKPIKPKGVLVDLAHFAKSVEAGDTLQNLMRFTPDLKKFINLNPTNSYKSLYTAVKHVIKSRTTYGKNHKIKLSMDLHSGNWLQHADGTIIAVDPWFGR